MRTRSCFGSGSLFPRSPSALFARSASRIAHAFPLEKLVLLSLAEAMTWVGASANAILMKRMSDLIEGIAAEALDNAEAWVGQGLAGWERAATVIDDLVTDAMLLTDVLHDILKREQTGEGHAVTNAELAMAQNHREILAMRLRGARRAVE